MRGESKALIDIWNKICIDGNNNIGLLLQKENKKYRILKVFSIISVFREEAAKLWLVTSALPKTILGSVAVAKPYFSMLEPPFFMPSLCKESHQETASPQKSGYRAF